MLGLRFDTRPLLSQGEVLIKNQSALKPDPRCFPFPPGAYGLLPSLCLTMINCPGNRLGLSRASGFLSTGLALSGAGCVMCVCVGGAMGRSVAPFFLLQSDFQSVS